MLAFLSLLALAVAAMMVAMQLHGQPAALETAAVFGAVSTVALGTLVWYPEGSGQPPTSRSRS